MDKRNLWTRALAFTLAVVMILSSQAVSSMGGTLSLKESQQQDNLSGDEDQENTGDEPDTRSDLPAEQPDVKDAAQAG